MWDKIKNIIIGVLILGLMVAGFFYNREHQQRLSAENTASTSTTLATNLHGQVTLANGQLTNLQRENNVLKEKIKYLPPEGSVKILMEENTKLKAQILGYSNNIVELTTQLKTVLDKLKVASTPEEIAKLKAEAAEIAKKLQLANADLANAQSQLQNMTVVTTTTGFTTRLGIGLIYSDMLKPEIDLKFWYGGHFSAVAGVAFMPSDVGNLDLFMAGTCHFNLFVPQDWNINNAEIGIGPAYNFRDQRFKLLLIVRSNL